MEGVRRGQGPIYPIAPVGEQPRSGPAGQVFRDGQLFDSSAQAPQKSNTRQMVYLGVVVAAGIYLYSPRTFWLFCTAGVAAKLYSQMEKANQPPPPVSEEYAIRLQLNFAKYEKQTYEFHAIWAMKKVQEKFDDIAKWIAQGNREKLLEKNQELIAWGNKEYETHGAKLERNISLQGIIYSYLDPSNQYIREVGSTLSCGVPDEDRQSRAASKVVRLLTENQEKPVKVVMLRIGEHPFPVIKQGGRVIFFDAPTGEFVLTKSRKAAEEHLKRILKTAKEATFEYTLIDIAPPKGV